MRRGRSRWSEARRLIAGLLLVASLVLFVLLRIDEEREISRLMRRAQPAWLLLAVLLQAGTYLLGAWIWRLSISRAGVRIAFTPLVPLSIGRLSIDQLVPTMGLSGKLVVIRAMARRGVPVPIAAGAVVADLVSHFSAQALGLLVGLLWISRQHKPPLALVALAATFVVLTPTVGLVIRGIADRLAHGASRALRQRGTMALCVLLQGLVMLLDGGTLATMLTAVGEPTVLGNAVMTVVVAEAAATVALLPGGIGPFEAASVAMLGYFGTPPAAALAATLLLRGFTLWLPLVPGLWLAREGLEERPARQDDPASR